MDRINDQVGSRSECEFPTGHCWQLSLSPLPLGEVAVSAAGEGEESWQLAAPSRKQEVLNYLATRNS